MSVEWVGPPGRIIASNHVSLITAQVVFSNADLAIMYPELDGAVHIMHIDNHDNSRIRQGYSSLLMKEFLSYCDLHKYDTILCAHSTGVIDRPNTTELISWYDRLGFKMMTTAPLLGKNWMIRTHQ